MQGNLCNFGQVKKKKKQGSAFFTQKADNHFNINMSLSPNDLLPRKFQ